MGVTVRGLGFWHPSAAVYVCDVIARILCFGASEFVLGRRWAWGGTTTGEGFGASEVGCGSE